MRYLAIITICLILVLATGCIGGDPDEEFRKAWQNSENDLKAYGERMRVAMGPEGSADFDIRAISEESKIMVGTIDRNYDTISKIPVSAQYAEAKREYLSALSDIRMACVDLSKAQDAGALGALGHITAAAPFLETSQQKRDRVKTMMG